MINNKPTKRSNAPFFIKIERSRGRVTIIREAHARFKILILFIVTSMIYKMFDWFPWTGLVYGKEELIIYIILLALFTWIIHIVYFTFGKMSILIESGNLRVSSNILPFLSKQIPLSSGDTLQLIKVESIWSFHTLQCNLCLKRKSLDKPFKLLRFLSFEENSKTLIEQINRIIIGNLVMKN